MDYINYVKQSPIAGLTGMTGGVGGLNFHHTASGGGSVWGSRGIVALGGAPSDSNIIEYFTVASTGNAQDFGDLSSSRRWGAATSSGSAGRGILAGGYPDASAHAVIDYITIANTGNASNFGTLVCPSREFAGVSNGTRGCFAGQYQGPSCPNHNVIQYITIASTGNSTDFGDLAGAYWTANSAHNGTRANYWGGYQNTTQVDTFAIDTTGNATDWGDMLYSAYAPAGGSGDETRGLWWGGVSPSFGGTEKDEISYFSFDTTGTATDFGNMIGAKYFATANNNDTRAVQCGGREPADSNIMEYVTIQSTGNAQDFGDLGTACSGSFAGTCTGD